MPELPEVQTTVNGINDEVTGLKIIDVWTDYRSHFHKGKDNIKNPRYFETFKKRVVGAKITKAERQGKNILVHLSNKTTMLVHMKMTGHFLYGRYELTPIKSEDGTTAEMWQPFLKTGPLRDPFNKYIHLVFTLSNKKHLAFSDLRRFGKVFLFETENAHTLEDLMYLGPDPLSKGFSASTLKERLLTKPRGMIKQVLMDQHVVSGIGNIYSDEILWASGIHPLSIIRNLPEEKIKLMWKYSQEILKKGINFGGDSDSDYRNIYGEPGKFQNKHNAYRRTGKPCPKRGCNGTIERLKVAGRSAHYCNVHQVIY